MSLEKSPNILHGQSFEDLDKDIVLEWSQMKHVVKYDAYLDTLLTVPIYEITY